MNPANFSMSQIGPGCVYSAQGNLNCGQYQSGQDPIIPMKPYSCSRTSTEGYIDFPKMSDVKKVFSVTKKEEYVDLPSLSDVKKIFTAKGKDNYQNRITSDIEAYQNKNPFNTAMNMSSSLMPWP